MQSPWANSMLASFSDAAWGVRPDGSSRGGYLVYDTPHFLFQGQEAPVGVIEWSPGMSMVKQFLSESAQLLLNNELKYSEEKASNDRLVSIVAKIGDFEQSALLKSWRKFFQSEEERRVLIDFLLELEVI